MEGKKLDILLLSVLVVLLKLGDCDECEELYYDGAITNSYPTTDSTTKNVVHLHQLCERTIEGIILCKNINLHGVDTICPSSYIHYLIIKDSNITTLLPLEFPDLLRFELHNTNIMEFHSGVFSKLEYLEHFVMENNPTKILPSDLFLNKSKIDFLSITKNKIEIIQSDLLSGTFQLRFLDLSYNEIKTIEPLAFRNLTQLKHLALNGNKLETFPDRLFYNLTELITLQLSNNSIQTINQSMFPEVNSNKLQVLTLSHNKIKSIDFTLPKNTELSLSYNLIEVIKDDVFKDSKMLQKLDLSNNQISDIQINGFYGLESLSYMKMNSNKLKTLHSEVFLTISNLQTIILSNNEISEIGAEIFESNRIISELDLSSNRIENVEFLRSLCNVVSLNMSNSLSNNIVNGNQILRIVTYEQTCRKTNEMSSELKLLDLSRNHLNDIDLGILFDAKSMQKLFLQDNNLIDIKYENLPLERTIHLEEIILDTNPWNCTYLAKMIKYFLSKRILVSGQNLRSNTSGSRRGGIDCVDCTLNPENTTSCSSSQSPEIPQNESKPNQSPQNEPQQHHEPIEENPIDETTSSNKIAQKQEGTRPDKTTESNSNKSTINSSSPSLTALIVFAVLSVILNILLFITIRYKIKKRNFYSPVRPAAAENRVV